jgi:8-oxo-dGTP pyrophosphatase MutT (NUDIX family)
MNRLRARLSCSFKGETHELDALIDLDAYPPDPDSPPNFHLVLAKAAGIDPISYLYEVVESHDIEFSEAEGLAAQCCEEDQFDWLQFTALRVEQLELAPLREIATRHLGVADLDQHPDLMAALQAAFQAGRRT